MTPAKKQGLSIQIWALADAPEHLRRELSEELSLDWLAYVPKELEEDSLLALFDRGPGMAAAKCEKMLSSGDLLLAGEFAKHAATSNLNGHAVTSAELSKSKLDE